MRPFLLFFFSFSLFSCGNTKDSLYEESPLSDTWDAAKGACLADPCENHDECTCAGAPVCVPSMAAMDPEIGDHIHYCTVVNCNPTSADSCPAGYRCHTIPMGNELFENAKTACIVDTSL